MVCPEGTTDSLELHTVSTLNDVHPQSGMCKEIQWDIRGKKVKMFVVFKVFRIHITLLQYCSFFINILTSID